jgi:hypothetical protein
VLKHVPLVTYLLKQPQHQIFLNAKNVMMKLISVKPVPQILTPVPVVSVDIIWMAQYVKLIVKMAITKILLLVSVHNVIPDAHFVKTENQCLVKNVTLLIIKTLLHLIVVMFVLKNIIKIILLSNVNLVELIA